MAEPAPQSTPEVVQPGPNPVAIQGGGHDRFGAIADLAVFALTARELADAYAIRLGITAEDIRSDPDVTIACIGLSICRQEELLLEQQIQRELSTRAEVLKGDYGMALFTATKNGVFERHRAAIDKAHYRANRYRDELKQLLKERAVRQRAAAPSTDPTAPRA